MEFFETQGPDGQIYIHEERWDQWRADRFRDYPCPRDKYRFDLVIGFPRERLEAVPVERNPHSLGGYGPHTCFYACDDWSTIYGVHDAHHYEAGQSFRMLVESGNPEPIWGERIKLFSTSTYIENEPWGRNPSNKFAYFRGMYWRIIRSHFLHPWMPGGHYPLAQLPSMVRAGPPGQIGGGLTMRDLIFMAAEVSRPPWTIPAIQPIVQTWTLERAIEETVRDMIRNGRFDPPEAINWKEEGF